MTRTGLLGFIVCLFISTCAIGASPVTYDQRQEGKVNVQVDVKDLQIVALIDSDFLGDYSYDYPLYDDADFTVKPQTRPTTAKPPSTTNESTLSSHSSASPSESSSSAISDSTTAKAIEEPTIKETNVAASNSSTLKISENTTKSEQVSSTESTIKTEEKPTESTIKTEEKPTSIASTINAESTTSRPLGTAEPRKRCPMGFQMRSGRCFKRRHSLISPRVALMKLAPALLGTSQLFNRHLTSATSS